jgi:hypothetical protein
MKVICINDKNKPNKVSIEEWVKEGQIYNVKEVIPLGLQPGKYGYLLEELQLSSKSFPYESYAAERFAIVKGIVEMKGEQMVYADEADLINI